MPLQIKLGQPTEYGGVLHERGEVIVVDDGYDLDDGDVILARIDVAAIEARDKAEKEAAKLARATRPAKIVSFTNGGLPVAPNAPVVLNWTTKRADTVTLEGDPVDLNGTATVTTKRAKTYKLTATNQYGEDNAKYHVDVSPEITAFTASATSVPLNTVVTFSWSVLLADSVTFEGAPVALVGSVQVTIKRTKTFNLVAISALGTDNAKIDITVV